MLSAGRPCPAAGAEKLGTAYTGQVAACLDGTGDVVIVGAKVRDDIAGSQRKQRDLHEICAAHDAEMKRNGRRLLELIGEAVRTPSDRECAKLRAVVRSFPLVAFRDERIATALDRIGVSDGAVRRWFGLKDGRGRPARAIPEARRVIGTLEHECEHHETIDAALESLELAGFGTKQGLANLRSSEGELYRLSVGGIWITADRLRRLPWVAPQAAEMRWDVYRLPA